MAYGIDTTGADTTGGDLKKSGKKAIVRWQDYYRNRFSEPRPRSTFYLKDPANVSTTIRLDTTGRVIVSEDVITPKGTLDFRPTESLDLGTYQRDAAPAGYANAHARILGPTRWQKCYGRARVIA